MKVRENSNVYVDGTRFRLEDQDTGSKLYHKTFGILGLADAAEMYKRAMGVKWYLAIVADKSNREPPFTLGVIFKSGTTTIHRPIPGMPGYNEGLEAGDTILSIDGYRMHDLRQYTKYMNSIPLNRVEMLNLEVRKKDGQIVRGKIQPDFFRENHWYYRKGGATSAFASNLIDGVTLGLWARANPNFKRKLELDQQIYEGASNLGSLGSYFIGGGSGLLKIGKAGSKANKAQKVAKAAKSTTPLSRRKRSMLDAMNTGYRPFAR